MDLMLRRITLRKLTGHSHEQVIDIVCLDNVWVPRRDDLPSWVVDWKSLWNKHKSRSCASRAGRFLSHPSTTPYRVCGNSSPLLEVSQDELALTCHGHKFDVICGLSSLNEEPEGYSQATGEPSSVATTCEHELSINQNIYGTESKLCKAIWLSAVHNPRKYGSDEAPLFLVKTFQELISGTFQQPLRNLKNWIEDMKTAGEFKIHGRELKHWFSSTHTDMSELQMVGAPGLTSQETVEDDPKFWSAFQIGELGRRMMETGKGYVGIAHKQSRVGDSIVLLQGASVPIILRPCEDGYRVIGEAYVHGIMNGEFWGAQDESTMQTFDLK
jgi:hypothetical protein